MNGPPGGYIPPFSETSSVSRRFTSSLDPPIYKKKSLPRYLLVFWRQADYLLLMAGRELADPLLTAKTTGKNQKFPQKPASITETARPIKQLKTNNFGGRTVGLGLPGQCTVRAISAGLPTPFAFCAGASGTLQGARR